MRKLLTLFIVLFVIGMLVKVIVNNIWEFGWQFFKSPVVGEWNNRSDWKFKRGRVYTSENELEEFDSIEADIHAISITFVKSEKYGYKIEYTGDFDPFKSISLEVKNKVLYIKTNKLFGRKMWVEIYIPSRIENFILDNNACNIDIKSIEIGELNMNESNASNIDVIDSNIEEMKGAFNAVNFDGKNILLQKFDLKINATNFYMELKDMKKGFLKVEVSNVKMKIPKDIKVLKNGSFSSFSIKGNSEDNYKGLLEIEADLSKVEVIRE